MKPFRHAIPRLTASAVGCALLMPIAAPATTTWTVQPGGMVAATSKQIVLKDLTTGSVIDCRVSVTVTLGSGSGLPGRNLGSIPKADFPKCVGGLGIIYILTARRL